MGTHNHLQKEHENVDAGAGGRMRGTEASGH